MRHLFLDDAFEIQETITSATGKHIIITEVHSSNLWRYDNLDVTSVCIGGINSYSACRMMRLIVKV